MTKDKTRYSADTITLKIDPDEPTPEIIALSGAVLRAGGLVAFPTETVYGLGANALDTSAVDHIFSAKGRPSSDPVIVHIADVAQLSDIAIDLPDVIHRLIGAFWPGALTFILKKSPSIPLNVTAGQQTVAVRMPDHPVALRLIQAAGVPVAAPSANRFSRPSPTSATHVLDDLEGHVDIVLNAGITRIGVESTILDLSRPDPVVLRPGGVPLEALQTYLPQVVFQPHYLGETVNAAPSPGTLLKHYSPDAQVWLFKGPGALDCMLQTAERLQNEGQKVALLLSEADLQGLSAMALPMVFSLGKDEAVMARRLFFGLRELDAQGVDAILVRAPQQQGLGLAIWDRLLRAAEGRIIET